MIAFEISIDGQRRCTAGVGDLGVLSVITSWVRRPSQNAGAGDVRGEQFEEELTLDVGGLMHDSDGANVNLKWLDQSLRVGQSMTVKVVNAATVDSPVSRQREDPAWAERRKREYYEQLKREYGDV